MITYQITPEHVLTNANFLLSPNHDERPPGEIIDLLVLHCISLPRGRFANDHVEQLFLNQLDHGSHPEFVPLQHLRVASHVFIKRSGAVMQFVPFNKRAWHAGVSNFQQREQCNDFSIGIELEGTDDSAFTTGQYTHLVAIIQALLVQYPGISLDRIVGHSDIAPMRKTDPGTGFDWALLRDRLRK